MPGCTTGSQGCSGGLSMRTATTTPAGSASSAAPPRSAQPTGARLGALLEEQAHAWPERLPAHSWGTSDRLHPRPPNLVVEVSADLALDRLRWRHPVRFVRARDNLQASDLASRAL